MTAGVAFLNGSTRNPNYLRAKISGFPPEFRNDEKEASPLNGSIILRSSPRQSSSRGPQYLNAYGFPIEDFENDGRGVVSECLYEESKFLKDKNTCIPR